MRHLFKAYNPALAALAVGAFVVGSTEFVVMGLLEQISQSLAVERFVAGWLVTGYALGVVIGAPVLATLTARIAPKTALLLMMAIFSAGNLACWAAPSFEALLVARVLTAFAHGTFFGVGAVAATKVVPKARQASAVALMFSGLTIATLLGVPVGAWLGQEFGWRMPFLVIAVFGVLACVALQWSLPRLNQPSVPQSDLKNSPKASLWQAAIVLKLLITLLTFGGFFVVLTYIQAMLQEVTGVSLKAVSAVLLVLGVGLMLGNLLGGRIADAKPQSATLMTLGTLSLALLLLPLLLPVPALAIAGFGVLGVCAFATVSPLQMGILSSAQGLAPVLVSTLNIAAFNLGNAVGAWVAGQLAGAGLSLQFLPWVGAGFVFVAGSLAWVDRHLQTREIITVLKPNQAGEKHATVN